MPKVSVLLAVYNAADTLDRCIQSMVDQTFEDWELICCDDCSKDASLQILNNWSLQDERIKILSNDSNRKLAYTRNKCIQAAKGEYIALMDDDDYCVFDRLEKQVKFLDQNQDYSIVGSQANYFDENGVWKVYTPKEKPQVKDFLWGSCFVNPSVMMRRKDVLDVGLYRVARETRRGQDYDLFMRMYHEGYRGYNIQEPLICYYRGKNSYVKHKYEYRIDEAIVRYQNFKRMNLLPKYILYVIKPLVIGLLPIRVIEKIKK